MRIRGNNLGTLLAILAGLTSFAVAASKLTAGVIYQWRVTATNGAGMTIATGGTSHAFMATLRADNVG